MHPNPTFRKTCDRTSLQMVADRGFGTLMTNADPVPLLAHVPFVLNSEPGHIDLHLVRSNPIARMITDQPRPAKLSVTGPDSYISPDWYGVQDQVPTWNYVAVHMTGMLHPLPQDDLPDLLDTLSSQFEERLAPKPVWTTGKMQPDTLEKMLRAIRPFRLHIEAVDSTWKLGQNKPDTVRKSAASQVAEHGVGTGLAQLADWMDTPPE